MLSELFFFLMQYLSCFSVRNFLSSVASGKRLEPPVIFQGGVASNRAVKEAFERELGTEILIPQYHNVMGAIGIAILARKQIGCDSDSSFKGFDIKEGELLTKGFDCAGCSNACEILEIYDQEMLISRWGSRCGRWDLEE